MFDERAQSLALTAIDPGDTLPARPQQIGGDPEETGLR